MRDLPKDREIEAIVPVYGERGDDTCIYLRDGRRLLAGVKKRAVLQALVRRRCKELSLVRAWSAARTHQKLGAPLAVSAELVLAPYKAREAKVAGDETMGCVNVAALTRVVAEEAAGYAASSAAPQCRTAGRRRSAVHGARRGSTEHRKLQQQVLLELRSGHRLPVLWGEATMHRHLQAARLVQADLQHELDELLLYRLASRGQ